MEEVERKTSEKQEIEANKIHMLLQKTENFCSAQIIK
jgi:hypothetical protein